MSAARTNKSPARCRGQGFLFPPVSFDDRLARPALRDTFVFRNSRIGPFECTTIGQNRLRRPRHIRLYTCPRQAKLVEPCSEMVMTITYDVRHLAYANETIRSIREGLGH